mgnify:CR=1 FL=1
MADRLVDSDVLIDALRGVRRANATLVRLVREGRVATTAVNVFELGCGTQTEQDEARLRDLLQNLEVLPLDVPSALEAARIDRELRTRGERIDARDTIIGGIARWHGIPLVTRNRRHFERIPGLAVEGLDPD